ncbi:MAG: SDR family NAD(P)-dependent oxidoreductase [Methanobacterium sp.]|jgi:NAD(P)-dependent dehydrogenase (short-subunit alcohol dehydrogenase family)|nr:SDR family NAD(P)-dependent oxidoreductase [Methanobacterium sp.]
MTELDYYKEKICIVTGANSGIGYALSEELLKRGAVVYMAGRNPEKIQKATEKLSKYSDRIHEIIVDVTIQKQVQKAIEDVAEEAGRLDFLFNNAGVGGTLQYEKATLDDWKTIIDVNLWSVIYGVHAAVPIMLKQGSGHIINTSSVAGIVPMPFQALYSLTKFGVTGLTESLRYEYAEKGLHFSTVCPANIATPIFKKSIDGTVYDHIKIPDDAIPPKIAAELILNKLVEKQGIIFVPEELEQFWQGYVFKKLEDHLLTMAHERRESYAEKGNYM